MCYEYELEYQLRRAEEARRELKKAEERSKKTAAETATGTAKPKPAVPAEAPPSGGQEEPVPV